MKQLKLTNRTLAAPMNLHRGATTARFHQSTRSVLNKRGAQVGGSYAGASSGGRMSREFTTGLQKGAFKFNTGL